MVDVRASINNDKVTPTPIAARCGEEWKYAAVGQEHRRAVVAALIELAASDDWQDRADAGRALASFAEMPESQEPLLHLVLDVDNVFVTRVTAEALLARKDLAGFTIVAQALASADDQHGYYIDDAVNAVFMMFASERDQAMEACGALALDASAPVRQGAAELRGVLAAIEPLLYPQDPA
ncbi:hypothetical protein GCM10009745_48900 [Kribbella yunnanensis]|uniref:HEAT repeat domain-containing protein n=1 Tax=Kribbella yunnanensis TaxID=190194 RepID=A0ABN2I1D8_9ACTN